MMHGISPLSSRDINRGLCRKEEDGDGILHRADRRTDVEKIKARFDRDFLPRYGYLWRRMVREKESAIVISDSDTLVDDLSSTVASSLPGPRAIDFVEAIERKQAVSINAGLHGEECECDCAPPIEDFIDIDEEQAKESIPERRISELHTSQSTQSEYTNTNTFETVRNSIEHFKTTSDEETETDIDEDDSATIYETADEFEDTGSSLTNDENSSVIKEKVCSVATRNNEYEGDEPKKTRNEKIEIIDVDALSENEDDSTSVDDWKNKKSSFTQNSEKKHVNDKIDGDDEEGSSGLEISEILISSRGKGIERRASGSITGGGRNSCLSPQSIPVISSPNQISKAITDDPFVDSEDESDDEDDAESDDDDEAEWIPDDELYPLSPKAVPKPKRKAGKEEVNRKNISETIDLCDSSSYGEDTDSDFDDEDSFDHKKRIPQKTTTSQKCGKGRSKASFRKNRDQITTSTFHEFNQNAFKGGLGKVVVNWSKKLNTTAGLTRLQKKTVDTTPGIPLERQAVIELSTKVVDDEEKLRTTLLHELVHAAVWIFEGVSRPPHGPDFKRWAKIAMAKIPDVVVTTTHNYQIAYKFNWACVNTTCSFIVGRHSKSVDTKRHRCGRCRGKLIRVNPDGAPKKQVQPSAYNLFVKQHSKAVRQQLVQQKPGVTQADVMKELGRLWREQKGRSNG